ncbi:MAG: hypothetical protein JWO02_4557 [Solirubrobacterales bacterium]|nr:hypothetical protein [Solirubrobacterales bacterium]
MFSPAGVTEQRPDDVYSDDLILTRHGGSSVALHRRLSGQPTLVGRFASARDAWEAVDAIDLAESAALRRAA